MSSGELSLGATIRAWRDRLTPAEVGLPARAGRAPGLRREDLAQLSGVSVDYVVRLEQGRATHPSGQVAASLARALQLSGEERDHLYRLAGLQPPGKRMVSEHVPPGMQRILDRLGGTPAAVFAADWQLVWWNPSWAALLGDPGAVPVVQRNLVRSRFPVAGDGEGLATWPVLSETPEASERAIVADLRRAAGRYRDDHRLAELIQRTLEGNQRFAKLWREGRVAAHAEDRKTIKHPVVGDVTVDCDILVDTDTELKVVVYTTRPGSEDETKVELAGVVGGRRGAVSSAEV